MTVLWKSRWFTSTLILCLSFLYYALLSAKSYTWVFVSGDSGDWLAASTMWFAPQPPGSPLYIILGHLLAAFPGDLPIKMTLVLSVIPGAIAVGLVYLIVLRETKCPFRAIVSSLVLLGAGVFLSQATILEEYALAALFLTAGYGCWRVSWRKRAVVCLGLGAAVHVVVLIIAGLWLIAVGRTEARQLVRLVPLFAAFGILPYGLTLWQLHFADPILAGGGLSVAVVREYLEPASVGGAITVLDFPRRLWDAGAIVVMSFGLAIVPALRRLGQDCVLLAAIAFPLWYYLTARDPTTWTYLVFTAPFVAIVVGRGLTELHKYHLIVVASWALLMILSNAIQLNADRLDNAEPKAREYLAAVQALPDGSVVLGERGGFETFVIIWAMAQGKDVVPVFFEPSPMTESYRNYAEWVSKEYELEGWTAKELAASAKSQGRQAFIQRSRASYDTSLKVVGE